MLAPSQKNVIRLVRPQLTAGNSAVCKSRTQPWTCCSLLEVLVLEGSSEEISQGNRDAKPRKFDLFMFFSIVPGMVNFQSFYLGHYPFASNCSLQFAKAFLGVFGC